MMEYAFYVKLFATIRVEAETENEARAMLADHCVCMECNGGAWPNGDPILFEASTDGVADLIEVNGEAV